MKQTMKQHSFTSQLKSLAVVFGIAMTFASCANEDVAQNPTNPNEDNDKNLTTFVAGDEAKTRTSLDYNSSDFYWEAGDYIYVKDDDNVLWKSSNAPTSKVTSFKYKVPGKFTAHTSYKVYYLGKYSNATDKKVTISTYQSQTKPDNTEHFGTAGDYGTATATKVSGKQQFAFELEHQAAYLVFQPYTSNTILQNCYLTKVEVTSDNDIAETYTVNTNTDNLDASAVTDGKKIVLTTRDWTWGSTYNNGFPLTNNTASVSTNGAYMVIKPGTHTLKVRYWIQDLVTHVEGTITKSLPATAYASNTYYDLTANLNVRDYDGDHYYMWDAQEQYWKGYEWNLGGSQVTPTNQSAGSDYPQNRSDANNRWYNESYPGYGVGNPATHTPCKDLPNVNEMTWYAAAGDSRWDADELWVAMGHLYKGGMWFKKKANISGFNPNTAYDGTDWRINGSALSWSPSQTPPSAADAGNYFFLPAMGDYHFGHLNGVSQYGCYWSSSAVSTDRLTAFYLEFRSGYARVFSQLRSYGFRVEPSFE